MRRRKRRPQLPETCRRVRGSLASAGARFHRQGWARAEECNARVRGQQ